MGTRNATAKFDKIIDLEIDVRGTKAMQTLGMTLDDRARATERLPVLRARLYALIDGLTAEEQEAFGHYRAQTLSG